jgi:hypothetical protein
MSGESKPDSQHLAAEEAPPSEEPKAKSDPKFVKIPTPWGNIEGTVPSLLLLLVGALVTYLVLLYFALPHKQPAILVDPVIEAVLTAQPTPTPQPTPSPRPHMVMLDENNNKMSPTEQQYEIDAEKRVQLLITPGSEDKLYRWSLNPDLPENYAGIGPFVGSRGQNEITFVAPKKPGTYMVTACEIDSQTDTCAVDYVRIVLVKPADNGQSAVSVEK